MEREPSIRELKYSIEQLRYLMSRDTIKVNDTVVDHLNTILKVLDFYLNKDYQSEQYMLETAIMWGLRQVTALYAENNAITPEFIHKFIIPKIDSMLKTDKNYQRDRLANEVVMNRLQAVMDPRVLLAEENIKNELDVLVKDLINYNRAAHDHRINQQGGE